MISYFNAQSIAIKYVISSYEKGGYKINSLEFESELPALYPATTSDPNTGSIHQTWYFVWGVDCHSLYSDSHYTYSSGAAILVDVFTGEMVGGSFTV